MTIPAMFQKSVQDHPDIICQYSRGGEKKEFQPTTYGEMYFTVEALAWSLDQEGVSRESHIGLISDNRKEWLILDLAILSLGAVDVPRGCDTLAPELKFILGFSQCTIAVLENVKQLEKVISLEAELPDLKKIILIEQDRVIPPSRFEVLKYEDLLVWGKSSVFNGFLDKEIAKGNDSDLATIIFTSGTTGDPKGVMLSHKNFVHQALHCPSYANFETGDIWLSVLPVWHSLERALEYIALGEANTIAYSKPVGAIMLADMQALNPQWMTSVPRIWSAIESGVRRNIKAKGAVARGLFNFFMRIASSHQYLTEHLKRLVAEFKPRPYLLDLIWMPVPWLLLYPLRKLGNLLIFNKIREKLGTGFKAGLSGGGALPLSGYQFFNAVGIQLLEGYGLTETAPILAYTNLHHPIVGLVNPIKDTEIRIVDEENQVLPPGQKGVIQVRGPQVMLGYYKRQDLTDAILDEEGWLNTGDLGVLSIHGELSIAGRVKDTIVLLGGENLEPVPIEQKLAESPFVEQAVVFGQDKKYLGALIVPDKSVIEEFAKNNDLSNNNWDQLLNSQHVFNLIKGEISRLVSSRNGFRSFEQIARFHILPKSFEAGKELSAKQDLKRHTIAEMYENEVQALFIS